MMDGMMGGGGAMMWGMGLFWLLLIVVLLLAAARWSSICSPAGEGTSAMTERALAKGLEETIPPLIGSPRR